MKQPPTERQLPPGVPVPGRVLMTADTVGGVWTYAQVLARTLTAWGTEVHLATMGQPLTPGQWEEALAVEGLTLHESTWQLEWMDQPWEDVERAGDWLLSLEARLSPDVVHLNGYCHGALPWRRPPLVVGHSCVLSWWEAVKGEAAPERYARYHREVARGLRAAGRVVAPTRAMLQALAQHYGPLPAAEVVPNAREPEGFPPGTKEPFILTAGRLWDEAKNVAALERVAPGLAWPVCVAGEDRHPSGPAGAPPPGLSPGSVAMGGVKPLGRLSSRALARWMGRASVFALPARYEPFGLSPLEAALAGCALVLGDLPSLREVWGDAALYVPPEDPDVLLATLQRLVLEPATRLRLATRARTRALAYAPARQAEAYLRLYTALAGAARVEARAP